jgi:hypothetical protein
MLQAQNGTVRQAAVDGSAPGIRRLSGGSAGNFDRPGLRPALQLRFQTSARNTRPAAPIDPGGPAPLSVKAASYLFSELYRLKILELDFFTDDDKVVDRRALVPDPAARRAFLQSLDGAERFAGVRLASRPDDPGALFALSMATGLETDYAALVERRRFGSFSLSKRNQVYARKLLALNPPVDDAYMTFGTVEYVVGSLPFYLRWLVRLAQIGGSKEKAIEDLELVARRGRYYGPLARMTLAVIHVREKRPDKAEVLLAGLVSDFPENPLFRKELLRVSRLAHPNQPARPN